MMSPGWRMVEATAQLLEGDQREAVLGDLLEAGESARRALLGVLSLVVRRQAAHWHNWRPWLAAFGVSLPASLLLMGASLSVSQSFQKLPAPALAPAPALLLLFCRLFLLAGWSWSGGFAVGSLSRKTVWVSALLCCSPCLFCLERFRVVSLSRFCLLLFLLPALLGVRQGLRRVRIPLGLAIFFAFSLTFLTFSLAGAGGRFWVPRSLLVCAALIWPAWYVAAAAHSAGNRKQEIPKQEIQKEEIE